VFDWNSNVTALLVIGSTRWLSVHFRVTVAERLRKPTSGR
jgi:hypothetical protein